MSVDEAIVLAHYFRRKKYVVFQTEEMKQCDWYRTMIGYYEACCLMLNKSRPSNIKRNDLPYRFEEAHRDYDFKVFCRACQTSAFLISQKINVFILKF